VSAHEIPYPQQKREIFPTVIASPNSTTAVAGPQKLHLRPILSDPILLPLISTAPARRCVFFAVAIGRGLTLNMHIANRRNGLARFIAHRAPNARPAIRNENFTGCTRLRPTRGAVSKNVTPTPSCRCEDVRAAPGSRRARRILRALQFELQLSFPVATDALPSGLRA